MVGRDVEFQVKKVAGKPGPVVLDVQNVHSRMTKDCRRSGTSPLRCAAGKLSGLRGGWQWAD